MTAQMRETVERKTAPGSPFVAHLVAPDDCCTQAGCDRYGSLCGGAAIDGATKAFQARIAGASVRTLCGLALVPSKDPRHRPTCRICLTALRDLTGAADDSACREG